MFKVLISGARDYSRAQSINMILDGLYAIYGDELFIIHGGATGADSLAQKWADRKWPGVTFRNVREYKAEWEKYNRAAGQIRNQQMYDEQQPDIVIGFSDDIENSKGTKGMLDYADKNGTPTFLFTRYVRND